MYRLSLRIDGDITIEAFRDAVGNFLNLLREVEAAVTGQRSVRWTLEDLHHGSPAVMTWKGTPRPQRQRKRAIVRPDYAPVVGRTLLSGVRKLDQGHGRPEAFTDDALDATLHLARLKMRRGITAVDLIGEGRPLPPPPQPPKPEMVSGPTTHAVSVGDAVNPTDSVVSEVVGVTERVVASVNDIIGPRYTAPGAVEGALQAINSRGLLHFVIYDSVFGARVRCDIPLALRAKALEAFDERVLVTGMVSRDSEGHPRYIKATSIEPILPGDLPQSIRGLDPEFTGQQSSAEYVKRSWSGACDA